MMVRISNDVNPATTKSANDVSAKRSAKGPASVAIKPMATEGEVVAMEGRKSGELAESRAKVGFLAREKHCNEKNHSPLLRGLCRSGRDVDRPETLTNLQIVAELLPQPHSSLQPSN